MISKLSEKLKDTEYRKAFVASQINIGIPFQVRALLKARGWTQDELAERSGMLQPRISAILKPGKTRPNIETLRRLANAFDCGLLVRFAPFSELLNWSEQFSPDNFRVPSFTEDFAAGDPELEDPATVPQNAAVECRRLLDAYPTAYPTAYPLPYRQAYHEAYHASRGPVSIQVLQAKQARVIPIDSNSSYQTSTVSSELPMRAYA
jgi:transcriptional regulator with XRE-family HTH domain